MSCLIACTRQENDYTLLYADKEVSGQFQWCAY